MDNRTISERMTPLRGEGDGFFDYTHQQVDGVVQVTEQDGQRNLAIYEWNSFDPGKGHAAEALAWLRTHFDQISVHGIGELDESGVGDISTAYWERQVEKGRVDRIYLDDGSERVVAAAAPRRRAGP